MPAVTGRVFIAAPPEQVFDYVADYRNALRFMHNFEEFRPIGALAAGPGARARAKGRLLGLAVHTTFEIVAYERPGRLVSRSYDGVRGTAVWEFAPQGEGTAVTFSSTYELPRLIRGPLRRAAERAVMQNAGQTLEKLKRALEAC